MKYKLQHRPIAIAVASAIAMIGVGSSGVYAQEQEERVERIEEIIIEAERRDTTASTTATSMQVLTGDDLAANQVVGFEDLQQEVPNLQFNTNGFGWAQANIRGVGNASGGGPFEQVGVPIIIDGGAQGEEISLGGAMMDVGNVQVLRGPQGTFIGQSAAGGAIVVTSARPNFEDVNGYMEMQLGTFGNEKLTGAVNLPISNTLAARVAILSLSQGSFYHNVLSELTESGIKDEIGSSDDRQIRLSLLWEPNEKFTTYVKLESSELNYVGNPSTPNPRPFTFQYDDDSNPSTPSIPVTSYNQYAPGPNGELYAPTEPYLIAHPVTFHANQKNLKYTIDLSYMLDNGISINSVTNWTEFYGVNGIAPNRNVPTGTLNFLYGPDNYTINQEVTVVSPEDQKLKWLVGASSNKRFTAFEWSLDSGQGSGGCGWTAFGDWTPCDTTARPPSKGPFQYIMDNQETTVEDLGIFFQLDYALTETIELNFGGRWNKNIVANQEYFYFPSTDPTGRVQCGGGAGLRGYYCPVDPKDWSLPGVTIRHWKGEEPTYRVGLNWESGDNQFVYAFHARGYKSGAPININDPTATPIVEELVDDYEFGWKGTLLDGALYAELGYFYQDYQDMQLSGVYVTSATTSGARTGNIGGATLKGFEGTLRASLGNFNITGTFGYTNSALVGISSYDSRGFNATLADLFPAQQGQEQNIGDSSKGCSPSPPEQQCFDFSPFVLSVEGAEMLNTPELSYNISVDYPFDLPNNALLTPKLSFRHADENYSSINQSGVDRYNIRDEVEIWDFGLTYIQNDWTVQAYINNLTDEVYVSNAGGSILYGDPRTAGVRARMSF